MKKAKKLLALALGVLMVMGCLSVSAANSTLTVTEEVPFYGYSDNFTSETMSGHVQLGSNTAYDSANGVIKSTGSNSTASIYLNQDKSPVTGTVVMEYNMKMPGGHGAWSSSAQMQMYFYGDGQGDQIIDMRWVAGLSTNGNLPSVYELVNSATPATLSWNEENISFKVVFYSATETMDLWVNGNQILTGAKPRFPHDNLTRVEFSTSGNVPFQVDDFKYYTLPVVGMPVPGEEIYRQDFEGAALDNSMVNNYHPDTVKVSQVNGALLFDGDASTNEKGALVYLQPNKEKLTGQYVVEMLLANPSYGESASSNGYHRISFGVSDCYLNWCPGKVLQYRFYGETDPYVYLYKTDTTEDRMEELKANGTTLKVTHLYDTNASSVKVWINDVFAFERQNIKANYASFDGIYFNLYYGDIELRDLHVYRPATFDATTGLSITEDENSVKIATNAAKDGRLFFATYTGSGDAASLNDLGTAALSMEPGKFYTISKNGWTGAKAFFWDNNLKPIVESWNLQ